MFKTIKWNCLLSFYQNILSNRNQINSKGNDETVYLKHVQNVVKNKKNRAQLLLEQYDKTQNLDFFNNEKENFSYSGF